MTRLRFDHTGLNKTLFLMVKSNSNECSECRVVEDVEHVLMHCRRFREERTELARKVAEAGRQWSLEGILGTAEAGVQEIQDALVDYLRETRLYCRI